MPYHVVKQGSVYTVKKKKDGKVMGHHATRRKAKKQITALYMHTDDMK